MKILITGGVHRFVEKARYTESRLSAEACFVAGTDLMSNIFDCFPDACRSAATSLRGAESGGIM